MRKDDSIYLAIAFDMNVSRTNNCIVIYIDKLSNALK